jgi:hypothetical protein
MRLKVFLFTVFLAVFVPLNVQAMDLQVHASQQFLDNSGNPCSGCKIYTYDSGTTDARTTYKERALSTAHTNPIICDSNGYVPSYGIFQRGLIKLVVKTSADVTLYTLDALKTADTVSLQDDDTDTKVQVEESADEDIIRFDIAGTEQLTIQDGKLEPTTDNDIDLGSSTKEFKDGYLDGDLNTDGIIMGETAAPTTAANEGGVHANVLNSVTELFFERESAGASVLLSLMENKRSQFTYKDGDEIYIGGGTYMLRGTSFDVVMTNTTITFELESAGSNTASDDYGADGWHYIYIDDTAVTTQASPILDADCFLNKTTAPVYDNEKKGWYNGNDLAIFAVYETGSVLLEFFHNGDLVLLADELTAFASSVVATDWSDEVTFVVPAFVREVNATFIFTYNNVSTNLYWRTEGQTGTIGHFAAVGQAGATVTSNTIDVMCSSNLKIDMKESAASNNTAIIYHNGWYFPNGM